MAVIETVNEERKEVERAVGGRANTIMSKGGQLGTALAVIEYIAVAIDAQ